MMTVFKNALVYEKGTVKKQDMLFDGATLSVFSGEEFPANATIISSTVILPGFCDVHVHFREPGFSYKETVSTGCAAAARGGYTAVCTMPNLSPTPDSKEHLEEQLRLIRDNATIAVHPYGTITVGELGKEHSDLEGIADDVIGYSDDGRGVQSPEMMKEAMLRVKALDKIIAAHCEDNSLLFGGYIHDGEYARAHGHKGICSESEYGPIKRDIELLRETGVCYHVCHVSAKESIEAIRAAKRDGIDITCETGPHYLTMNDTELMEDGRFKMNPPIRSEADRLELIKGIKDGTVDMIATDHAPHSAEEKSRGLEKSAMGVVGLETSFAVLYTELVEKGVITLTELVRLMSENPRERFGIKDDPGYTVFEIGEEYEIDPREFASMGKATPFAGKRVKGKCLLTVYNGKPVYKSELIK